MTAVLARLLRRPWAVLMAALALAVPLLAAVPASGDGTAAGCRVDYTVDQWATPRRCASPTSGPR
jgi:hypothetical protein